MEWRTTGDVAEFLAAAGDYLRRDRVSNTVILTVTEQLRLRSPSAATGEQTYPGGPGQALFGWWTGPEGGAFMHTPPHPLLLTALSFTVAADLAGVLADRPLSGLNANPEGAGGFSARWRALTGGHSEVHLRQRLYRLGALAWPDPAPAGAPRLAGTADLPLLTRWLAAFAEEVHDIGGEDLAADARDRVGYGGVLLWEAGGDPVGLAATSRQVARMTRVGPVYTPPELRGRGYASAATAAVTQRALDAGAEDVLLYTDVTNPVANSIYQRLGYRPVEDRVLLSLSAAG
jgi:GNAT superfamily N-acetyltransferase